MIESAILFIKKSPFIASDNTWKSIEKNIRQIIYYKNIREIILLPEKANIVAKHDRLDSKSLTKLAALGIVGWTIWTLQDKIRDRQLNNFEDDLMQFSILRPIFEELLFEIGLSKLDLTLIHKVIGIMEYANSNSCHFSMEQISVLKSIGVCIPTLVMLMKMKVDRRNIDLCYRYFYYLIAARQLSDDALDWADDMRNGRKTFVTQLLKNSTTGNLPANNYKFIFNRIVSRKVANKIVLYSRKSICYSQLISCFSSTKFIYDLAKYYEEIAKDELVKLNKKALNASA